MHPLYWPALAATVVIAGSATIASRRQIETKQGNHEPGGSRAMGYRTSTGDTATGDAIRVRRVKLDSGGYAPDGAYFGTGAPLYTAESDDGEVFITLRAGDHASAKTRVRAMYPNARVR